MFTPSRAHPRARLYSLIVACAVAAGCSGAGAGCGGLTPIPGGHFTGTKNDNAINLRLSANGINYLNGNWQSLISAFAPGGTLTMPVPCTHSVFPLNIPIIGTTNIDVYIADQGNASGAGRLDGSCNGDVPANVTATIKNFQLVPQGPDKLAATVTIAIDTGKIYIIAPTSLCDLKCSIDYSSVAVPNQLVATLQFSIDTRWDKLLAFNISSINGTQVCGSSGAPASPQCIDPNDLSLNSEGGFCSFGCDVLNISLVKNFVLGLLSPTLQTQIQATLAKQSCQACMTNTDCPTSTDGSNTQATCTGGICLDPASTTTPKACVPRFLGTEGRLNLAGLLGSFGAPADAAIDLSIAAGSSVLIDQGMTFGTRAGIKPVTVSACVPPAAMPPMNAIMAPDFDAEATPGSGYHVALGLSSNFLNATFWAAQQSGALCLQIGAGSSTFLNTGLFKTFLPSLGKLATRDGLDAPMLIALRPAAPPTVTVGLGTYDPVTKKPIKPLITVGWKDLSIDFYAMIDDRQARLFTLTADLSIPLSLIFNGCDSVSPALGDLTMLITNIRTSNSEMLAEDPQVLADLVPSVIGLAEPALAGALKGFALPKLGAFQLKVNESKGVGLIAGTETYNHLALYATLLPIGAMCATSSPRMLASLIGSHMPQQAQMRLDGHHQLPLPEAVLHVEALGKPGSTEFSYQVDDGLWSSFRPVERETLTVSHSRFLMQGPHVIHVRSRVAEDPQGISAPADVGFMVDWDAPEVALTADPAHDRLTVVAHDVVSAANTLKYAYQVGDGAFSDFGEAREIALHAVEQQGGVTVRVKDELGNVGEASFHPPTLAVHGDTAAGAKPSSTGANTSGGCSATGGLELMALAVLALARRRRQ
jgi:hypothetical protein